MTDLTAHGVGSPRTPALLWLGALWVVATLGWNLTWFLCDDAYITFRHVANAMAGHGLVWNAPPFQPVEGVTSLSWPLLLWGVWALTGMEPPDSANLLALGFGFLTLLVCARLGRRLCARHPHHRAATGVCLLAIAGNRTFVTWLSSGLEESAFQFFLLWWCERALAPAARRDGRWLATFALAASLAALTRPDGLLCAAATACIALLHLRPRGGRAATLVAASPLLLVPLHLLWRHSVYGEWLPNTYYAKVTEPWPAAGWRYLVCFLVEHGTWLPLLLGAPALAAVLRRPRAAAALLASQAPAAGAAAVLAAQAGYYVLRVGGDHFEYRVLAPLVPVASLLCAWVLVRRRPLPAALLALAYLAASSLGWVHKALTAAEQPYVSASVPRFLRPVTRPFDALQAFLLLHRVCVRADYHALFLRRVREATPSPGPAFFDPATVPLVATSSVGFVGWALRDAYVLDTFGLCDWVVARTPVPGPTAAERAAAAALLRERFDHDRSGYVESGDFTALLRDFGGFMSHRLVTDALTWQTLLMLHDDDDDGRLDPREAAAAVASLLPQRMMAHERRPPPGYVESFRPNVSAVEGRLRQQARNPPMTPADVVRLERGWRAWIADPTRPPPR